MKQLGLIGKNIGYSFSEGYFKQKFQDLNLSEFDYAIFDLQDISEIENLLQNPEIIGFNATIPYKQQLLPFLDELSPEAKQVGAVNTVKVIHENGQTKKVGYNTDIFGFEQSFVPLLKNYHTKALILGNGGATKAVEFILKKLNIPYAIVTRKDDEHFSFDTLTKHQIEEHKIIINCTPIGTFPNINDAPDIPYEAITEQHYLYDLIYNPEETSFLKKGKEKGATTKNGLDMLHLQAEKAWEIWNS